MQNPYTTLFGKIPNQMIPRAQQTARVTEAFSAADPSQQVYVVAGVRGSGKTVFMTEIANTLARDERWVVEELNVEQDLLLSLAAKLNSRKTLSKIFIDAEVDLSLFGLGLRIKGTQPIADIETALERMLQSLKRGGKRLLITIDEVVNNAYMRAFVSAFQILVRKDLPVFLLMTGIYENIESLQNEKSLTFLYRAPKIRLEPLGVRSIASNYMHTFDIDKGTALEMARRTSGYSFAFQLLGSLAWEYGDVSDRMLEEYRIQLYELSYDKIWNEMSRGDRRIVYGIASAESPRVQDIRRVLRIESNQFSPYRRRLINKGIIDGSQHGQITFALPCFAEYVLERYGETE